PGKFPRIRRAATPGLTRLRRTARASATAPKAPADLPSRRRRDRRRATVRPAREGRSTAASPREGGASAPAVRRRRPKEDRAAEGTLLKAGKAAEAPPAPSLL